MRIIMIIAIIAAISKINYGYSQQPNKKTIKKDTTQKITTKYPKKRVVIINDTIRNKIIINDTIRKIIVKIDTIITKKIIEDTSKIKTLIDTLAPPKNITIRKRKPKYKFYDKNNLYIDQYYSPSINTNAKININPASIGLNLIYNITNNFWLATGIRIAQNQQEINYTQDYINGTTQKTITEEVYVEKQKEIIVDEYFVEINGQQIKKYETKTITIYEKELQNKIINEDTYGTKTEEYKNKYINIQIPIMIQNAIVKDKIAYFIDYGILANINIAQNTKAINQQNRAVDIKQKDIINPTFAATLGAVLTYKINKKIHYFAQINFTQNVNSIVKQVYQPIIPSEITLKLGIRMRIF